MELTISGNDRNSLKKIEELAKRPGLHISRGKLISIKRKKNEALMKLMEEMAASGGIESIKEPIDGQKEERQIGY